MGKEERDKLLHDLQISQQQIIALLESVVAVQDWQREPAEWSFRYIAAHLAAVERKCHLRRITAIASGTKPQFSPYFNRGQDFGHQDLRASLRRWVATRRELIAFVRTLEERQLEYIGIQQSVGPITILDALQEMLEQDQGNLRHVLQLIVDYHEETTPASIYTQPLTERQTHQPPLFRPHPNELNERNGPRSNGRNGSHRNGLQGSESHD